MQYTVRAFIEGRNTKLDAICRTFSSMERTAYNLLRDGANASTIKATLRERYIVMNARWIQSVTNQASAVMGSQEEGIQCRIEMYQEKIRTTKEKKKRLLNPLKIQGCEAKITRLQSRIDAMRRHLNDGSYPRATFGSRKLLHQLSIAEGNRRKVLRERWKASRSNHFFSVGQANQRGNGNTRLSYTEGSHLEIRNWYTDDFKVKLEVPEYGSEVMKNVVYRASSVKLGRRGEVVDGGLAYSVRVARSTRGYQVLVSFELNEPIVEWNGRIAGIDINPEGIACTIASKDGNLVATRFFRDNRLISASKNKRKWVLENLVNRMLRWVRNTHGCNAVAVEALKLKGAYDYSPKTNMKLSNFMRRKMLQTISLHALKMNMLSVEVNPAYTSKVAMTKYGKQFGGFNRHQLAAFVIARRALGYGEAPLSSTLPKNKKERGMWNHCIKYYGYLPQVQTLLHHEPMEWKSDGDGNGGEAITELLIARPTNTSAMGLGHDAPMTNRTGAVQSSERPVRQVGSVHPNRHTNGGDGATGYRVDLAPSRNGVSNLL